MSDDEKVKGPASYFPSIEKKYGHPVGYWFDLLQEKKELWRWSPGSRMRTRSAMVTPTRSWPTFATGKVCKKRKNEGHVEPAALNGGGRYARRRAFEELRG